MKWTSLLVDVRSNADKVAKNECKIPKPKYSHQRVKARKRMLRSTYKHPQTARSLAGLEENLYQTNAKEGINKIIPQRPLIRVQARSGAFRHAEPRKGVVGVIKIASLGSRQFPFPTFIITSRNKIQENYKVPSTEFSEFFFQEETIRDTVGKHGANKGPGKAIKAVL